MKKNCFYDYQKERYSIIERYAGDYYFIRNDKTGKYIIVEADKDFLSTKKSIKSLFNKYDSKVMYDIKGFFGEGLPEEQAVNQWEEFKRDVYITIQNHLIEAERLIEQKEAMKKGWSRIDSFESRFDEKDGTPKIILLDKKTGREFKIYTQDYRISFKELEKDDLIESYGDTWVRGYNETFGNTDFATKKADCVINAFWRCQELYNTTPKEKQSEVFTKEICLDVIQAEYKEDQDAEFSYYMNKATAVMGAMINLNLPLAPNELLGDITNLPFDYIKISDRVNKYFPALLDKLIKEKKETASKYCENNEIKLYLIQNGVKLERENSVKIREGADWELEAVRFIDPLLSKPMYQIELLFDNEYLQQKERIIMGTAQETDILRLHNKKGSNIIDNIPNNAVSKQEGSQKIMQNVME